MIAFLQTHFREKLTLDQVAQAASVSRNTCLSCFRRVLGLSPMEYLTQRRLEYALHLLLTSDLPVAQVAEACGFGDASYFGKRFRKQMGLTPSQYRHRHPATRQPFPANGDL
ncbi:MAG: helix-turn-helix domain-containing protein [Evtepia gabavorous]